MADERNGLQRPTKAQNIFAITLVVAGLAAVVIGGSYMRKTHEGAPPSNATGAGASIGALDSIKIGDLTAQIKGNFKTSGSDVKIEFNNAQGQPADVGKVKLALDMPMPGMTMHADANVNGSGGRYTASVKPDMAGSWTAKLSFRGPQGEAEKTFPVNVK